MAAQLQPALTAGGSPRASVGLIQAQEHGRERLIVAGLIIALASITAYLLFPSNFFLFRAAWLLHPYEQAHLALARHLADTGSLVIDGSGYDVAYRSEDGALVNGDYVPRSVLLPYLIYAFTFLISDSAWLAVTPVFGLLAVIATWGLVLDRTGSKLAATLGAAMLLTASPFALNASGIASVNVIALALLLAGLWVLDRHLQDRALATGVLAGLLLGAVSLSRLEIAPAALLASGAIGLYIARDWRMVQWRAVQPGDIAAFLLMWAAIASILVTNTYFYGNPLHTGYGDKAWQGTAGGVTSNLAIFDAGQFLVLSKAYLIDMGLPQTMLLALGVCLITARRKARATDVILIMLSLFLVYLNLGKGGANDSGKSILNLSPPRYILPVYAAGAVLGISALHQVCARALSREICVAVLVAVGLIAGTFGVRDLYMNPGGAAGVRPYTERLRAVHQFARDHPNALFVGDLNTKAIITTPRTLIPRLVGDDERTTDLIRSELKRGRAVYVVDDPAQLSNTSLYSGYIAWLARAGLIACPMTDARGWRISQVIDPDDSIITMSLPVTSGWGSRTPTLDDGTAYYAIVDGTFVYNAQGATTDGARVFADGGSVATTFTDEHVYCRRIVGKDQPVTIALADTAHNDNAGRLRARLVPAAQ